MASCSEKELGDKLIEAGNKLLSPPSSIDEVLNQLDSLKLNLSKVDQEPPKLLLDALLPAMKALIANELLMHTDTDVKVSVASCINEIIRITAPDAPYNDKEMKECFQLTVTAFGKLSHVSSQSYTKAASILDTVAKIRSCVVMLDLECDALVIEMFQLFLKIIRSNHPHAVFENMEIIMTLIIEESEDISWELLSTLLDSVKKEKQNALPMSFKLGEKVINNCAAKLKSYLMKAVESMGIDLNDYAWTVSSICKTLSDNMEQNHVSACEEQMVVSELAPGVVCPGEVGGNRERDTTQTKDDLASSDKNTLKTLGLCCQNKQSEITDEKGNGGSDNLEIVKPVKSVTGPEIVLNKRGRKPNSLMNPEEGYDHSWISRETQDPKLPRRRKKHNKVKVIDDFPSENSVSQEKAWSSPDEKNAASQVFSPEITQSETIGASSTPNGSLPDGSRSKRGRRQKEESMTQHEADKDSSSVPKERLCSTPIKDKPSEPPHGKHVASKVFQEISQCVTNGSTPTPNHNLPDESSMRGRRQKKGSLTQQDVEKNSPSVPKGCLFSAPVEDEAPKRPDVSVKMEAEDTSNLVAKTPNHPDKKPVSASTIRETTPVPRDAVLKEEGQSDFEKKPMVESIMNVCPKGIDEKGSSVQCIDGDKRRGMPKKSVTEESGEKNMVTSRTKVLNESNLGVTPKKNIKRKRTPRREEGSKTARSVKDVDERLGSKTPHSVKDLDERLLGSRIKVWWPKDKTFYDGVVYAFDHTKKKHKVLYADGDEEVLNLGKQRWELIEDGIVPDEDIEIDAQRHEGSFDVPEKKENQTLKTPIRSLKSKTSTMKEKSVSSSKRFGPSTDKPADDCAMDNPFVLNNSELHNTGEEPQSNSLETRGLERLSELADAQASLKKSGRKRNRGISV